MPPLRGGSRISHVVLYWQSQLTTQSRYINALAPLGQRNVTPYALPFGASAYCTFRCCPKGASRFFVLRSGAPKGQRRRGLRYCPKGAKDRQVPEGGRRYNTKGPPMLSLYIAFPAPLGAPALRGMRVPLPPPGPSGERDSAYLSRLPSLTYVRDAYIAQRKAIYSPFGPLGPTSWQDIEDLPRCSQLAKPIDDAKPIQRRSFGNICPKGAHNCHRCPSSRFVVAPPGAILASLPFGSALRPASLLPRRGNEKRKRCPFGPPLGPALLVAPKGPLWAYIAGRNI